MKIIKSIFPVSKEVKYQSNMRLFGLSSIFLFFSCSSNIPEINYEPSSDYALDQYSYFVDLKKIEEDRAMVSLECKGLGQDRVIFHFPKTIPGTYKELDYGEMIDSIIATDSEGKRLTSIKIGKNSFEILNAKDLSTISYWVNDTWDHPKAKTRIWPMGGTNIEDSLNFVVNASGWFGFFDGLELVPLDISFLVPEGMNSFSALPLKESTGQRLKFRARDYHHLIDCPIMISSSDTSTFMVANTKVFIESYHANGERGFADVIKKEIQPSMEAVSGFIDSLPVDEYHFILYLRDGKAFMEVMRSKEVGLFKKIKTAWSNRSLLGAGALEHGNSSFYVLSDFGDTSFTSMIKRVALHEFMHIITPLNLHSEQIGNFDYVNPKMSKHLWLYEGITEYFANLILVRSGLITEREFFNDRIRDKISRAKYYPEKKIPFTEMSKNVFDKKYGRHYWQVYERGALIGLLLDIEIIRLTDGKKTLKDIILELSDRYGPENSFDEEGFFDEFTALVHPDLRQWFSEHIEGKVPLDIEGGLARIGVEYSKKGKHDVPKRIFSDYGTKTRVFSFGKYREIKKVGKKDKRGFQIGDQVNASKLDSLLYDDHGYPFQEGTIVDINVKRDDEFIEISHTLEYKNQKYKHRLLRKKDPTKTQAKYYSVWKGS